jgi:hypothetical protein
MSDTLSAIDTAIAELDAMTNVGCGAVHERGEVSFIANDCPIRTLAKNMACCHPNFGDSAAATVARQLDAAVKLEKTLGTSLLDEAALRSLLACSRGHLSALDRTLANKHKVHTAGEVRERIGTAQKALGARIDAVRLEVLEALRAMREITMESLGLESVAY